MKFILLTILFGQIGLKEPSLMVEKYLNHVRLSGDYAWCAAFVSYNLEKAGYYSPKYSVARNFLKYGEPTLKPKLGDLVILWREEKNTWKGHVGFYMFEDNDKVYVLGGNQSNRVSIKGYYKFRILGYRKINE